MLITLSYPIADYRPFMTADTYRFDPVDTALCSDHDSGFLRSFGGFSHRYAAGEISQQHESIYATADKGIHFERFRKKDDPSLVFGGHFECVFRRAFLGPYSARFDIGLTNRSQRWLGLGAYQIEAILDEVLDLRFYANTRRKGRDPRLDDSSVRAERFGPVLKKKYAFATTRDPRRNLRSVENGWLSSRTPVMVCETDDGESGDFHAYEARRFQPIQLPGSWDIRLFYKVMGREKIPVWVMVAGPDAQAERLRALRIWLLKWHQEKETFRGLICCVGAAKEKLDASLVADCLSQLLRTLNRKKRNGIPADQVANAILGIDDQIDKLTYERFLRFVRETPSTKHLYERTKVAMERNTSGTVNNFFGPIDHSVIVTGQVYGNVTNGLWPEIEATLAKEDLAAKDRENAMKMLAEIQKAVTQKKEQSTVKKLASGLVDFLVKVGATAASTLVQEKLKTLF